MSKNPDWTRDELILALDLYRRLNPSHVSQNHPDIVALSELLNSLPIHPQAIQGEKFRNSNGVYMKLCNFLRFDPSYSGAGLERGGKLEEEIWNEFSKDWSKLSTVASAIRIARAYVPPPSDEEERVSDEIEEFPEGRILTQWHRRRERNPALTKRKKEHYFKTHGHLQCEVCGFDFFKVYGELGKGFAECHHRKPVSELVAETNTKLADLTIVCANCHRMIHRVRPWQTVEQLRARLKIR